MTTDRSLEELRRLAAMLADELSQTAEDQIDAASSDVDAAMLLSARAGLAAARIQLGKAKLRAAKQASTQDRLIASRRRTSIDPDAARRRLGGAITNVAPANRFTLAARDGQGVPDADLPGLIEDTEDLGINLGPDKDDPSDAS